MAADQAVEAVKKEEKPITPIQIVAAVFGALLALWVFLLGLDLLGGSFKVLGGRGAGGMFSAVDNPIAGLMVGILATVLVQSSSTSTSIVVGLVGAEVIPVKEAIPIIMGANIGTSVTNTIVSMGQSADRIELERAFSGATVHDMFNFLTVAVLLPIEIILAAIQGTGGLLYWISKGLTDALIDGEKGGDMFDSPIKAITSPITSEILSANKYIVSALSLGKPKMVTPPASVWNTSACSRRLAEVDGQDTDDEVPASPPAAPARSLLSRRLAGDCTNYYCLSKDLNKTFSKISSKSYKKSFKNAECSKYLLSKHSCLKGEVCLLKAGDYWTKKVESGRLIKGGFLEGAGDGAGGVLGLIISLLMMIGGLFGLVKSLQFVLMGKAKKAIIRATNMNVYLAMVAGIVITILVQSSSITTSALTPLCGVGVLRLEQMFPITLGANIGTTVTGLIAALADLKPKSLQIAFCHLLFNIIGILIWFPVPIMRQIPLNAARTLGLYASYYRFVPLAYIFLAFVILPGICLGVSALYGASIAGGVILTLLLLGGLVGFEVFWWMKGCYMVLSKEQREEGERELALANAKLMEDDSTPSPAVQEPQPQQAEATV